VNPTRATLALVAALALPTTHAGAQHGPGSPPTQTNAPREAKQFDFLVGQWALTAEPKVSVLVATFHGQPKLPGTWKAWRALDGFGIEDEMRLTDDAGNPRSLAHSVRIWNRQARKWSSSTLDVYRSRFSEASAEWKGGVMTLTTRGTADDGRPYVLRAHFYDIRPNAFRWRQDRSYDGGRTWDEGTLRIEAKRVAAVAPR